jgi:hypothetical protein
MKKLGKTAEKILASMEARYGRYAATSASGHGSEGGKINNGHRETRACQELVDKGYAVLVNRHHFRIINHGWGQTCFEISIKLPGVE